MESFDNREQGFESAFAHDEETAFRVRIGGLRRLARWAAETLKGADPHAYEEAFIQRALGGATDETLLGDLANEMKGADVSLHRLQTRLAGFTQDAAQEVQSGTASGANQATTRS